jgi:hypothetical protein
LSKQRAITGRQGGRYSHQALESGSRVHVFDAGEPVSNRVSARPGLKRATHADRLVKINEIQQRNALAKERFFTRM